jgi:hypothetical protein
MIRASGTETASICGGSLSAICTGAIGRAGNAGAACGPVIVDAGATSLSAVRSPVDLAGGPGFANRAPWPPRK